MMLNMMLNALYFEAVISNLLEKFGASKNTRHDFGHLPKILAEHIHTHKH